MNAPKPAPVRTLVALLPLALLPVVARAQLFGATTTYATGTQPNAFAVGDLDRDGRPDLVTANAAVNTVSVLLGNGAGGFAAPTPITVGPAGSGSTWVALGDVNSDGRLDLAVANTANAILVLLGNGAGGFAAPTSFAVGTFPTSVAIVDLNRDGRPDLVAAIFQTASVAVLLGNGAGGFGSATSFPVGVSFPDTPAIGDLNRDGVPDLAVPGPSAAGIAILLGNGTGGFGAPTPFPAGTNLSGAAIGDVNGDGRADVVVSNSSSSAVSVLLGNGAGGLATPQPFATAGSPRYLAIGDVNRDGRNDVIVGHNSGVVSVMINNGAGSFTDMPFTSGGSFSRFADVADLDADGNVDLLNCNPGSNTVSVRLGLGVAAGQGLVTFGSGTPSCGGALGMTGNTPPRIGTPGFALACTNAPRASAGFVLLATTPDVPGSDPLGLGLRLHVDLASPLLLFLTAVSDASGTGYVPLPIPGQASLVGAQVHAQGVWIESGVDGRTCSTAAIRLLSSRGVSVTFRP